LADDLAAAVKPDSRRTVLYVGGIPLNSEFKVRRLQAQIAPESFSFDDPQIRGLIFDSTGDLNKITSRANLAKWLRAKTSPAAQRGIIILIRVRAQQVGLAQNLVSSLGKAGPNVIVRSGSAWSRIAEDIARYDCGPAQNMSLQIVDGNDQPAILDPELACLLRRAFWDFSKLKLTIETGGLSKADGIWKVEATAADNDLRSPFVVKCGDVKPIGMQIRTYRDVVADRVPYRGCAPLCIERSIQGDTKQLAVSRFVEHATRLDHLVLTSDTAAVVRSIYTRLLSRWRENPSLKSVSPFRESIPAWLWHKYIAELTPTYDELVSSGRGPLLEPKDLLDKLDKIPQSVRPYCRAHDDLNLRNVFICEGRAEAVLIDFTRAQYRPLSKDCVRLDVGLGFDRELHLSQPIPDAVLEDFYTGDLFSISLSHVLRGATAAHRLKAVEAIRSQFLHEADVAGFNLREEYSVAIAAELLWLPRIQVRRDNC
jgi:hypothetical protein